MNNDLSKKIASGCLLTSGNIDNFNTMTIGWGMIGTLWGKECFLVFVRPSRYTYQFMENNEYFTVSFYNDKYKKAMGYLGTKSGRDENKVKNIDFAPLAIGESVTFKEAYQTYLCKKIYFQDMNANEFPNEALKKYYPQPDIHRLYIGEIISDLKVSIE